MTDETSDATRTFEMTIDIAASPEDVWRALTEAGELVRWFPLEAHVTPGEGGTMRWSWGEGWSGEARIEAWEPAHRLRLVEDRRQVYDAQGNLVQNAPPGAAPLAIELTLASSGGTTTLRLVHSGFERGAGWDDEFDGISTGWQYELRSLKHYLERQPGQDRRVGWARAASVLGVPEVWDRLFGPGGLAVEGEPTSTVCISGAGERFCGSVLLTIPQRELVLVVNDLGAGILRVSTHRAAGQTGVSIWLASYRGSDFPRVEAFAARAQDLINELFA
jgi:uncharacterized protein YndB with AHSA1/START domain